MKEKHYSDVIDAAVQCISKFGNDHFITHFILCFGSCRMLSHAKEMTIKEQFLSKIKKYEIRSAILTILGFQRSNVKTKEEVKQRHLRAQKVVDHKVIDVISSEDSDLFYTSLQNPEGQPTAEQSYIFLTQKLSEKELTLLKSRNKNYLDTFSWYRYPSIFDSAMKIIEQSSDPESIYSESIGYRKTIPLMQRFGFFIQSNNKNDGLTSTRDRREWKHRSRETSQKESESNDKNDGMASARDRREREHRSRKNTQKKSESNDKDDGMASTIDRRESEPRSRETSQKKPESDDMDDRTNLAKVRREWQPRSWEIFQMKPPLRSPLFLFQEKNHGSASNWYFTRKQKAEIMNRLTIDEDAGNGVFVFRKSNLPEEA